MLVHAYEEYGIECVRRLVGMFAFAIWDGRERRMVVARDRPGLKPLYYYHDDHGRFAFASEIKAHLTCPLIPRRINRQGLSDLFGYEFVPAPGTLFERVAKLLPGTLAVVGPDGGLTVSRYWELEEKEIEPSTESFLDVLGQACSDHTVSDVPIGAFLSGGIDCSTVVHFASQRVSGRLETFALGYEEASLSEFDYARVVAKHFGTAHQELLVTPVDEDVIRKSVWHLESVSPAEPGALM